MTTVYLDNNATTRLSPTAYAAMQPYLDGLVANPSSLHQAGQAARRAVEHARAQVASLFECKPAQIIFTSGGTESIHLAVLGTLRRLGTQCTLITSAVEHVAGVAVADRAEKEGAIVQRLSVDTAGRLRTDNLDDCLNSPPGIVSLIWVNNETGVIHDLEPIATAARAAGFVVHVDAVQAAGKLPLSAATESADLISVSAHKLHGPQGVGALWMRAGLTIDALQQGGHQERDLRAGTENVPGIVGFGAAAEEAATRLADKATAVKSLRDRLEQDICSACPNATVVAQQTSRVDNTTTICFDGIPAESLLIGLSERRVYASSGSACSSGSVEPSHVLVAMGLPISQLEGAIRFSLSRETTGPEIDTTVAAVKQVVNQLRALMS